ncbi:voltage-gated potassium channel [Novimethylophilus kurashikiensis]|uniref:Voltage-gated potassium channel n=1 Tax=Novimethylophilus kurashikiensis TaxID=1825523 RepID=A0A2R5F781_9PROT|nr:potassium channel family protein [Novimethylophilus kurashikiensis]GBG12763.1 voltage-gated potassium channel [Novimethylophilus kurashikiensis]
MALNLTSLLGVTGVDPSERGKARIWAQRLEWPLLLVALWIPVQWYLDETGSISPHWSKVFDWIIWIVFLFETVLLTSLVHNKRRYLLNNWMNLVIIVGGLPIEWQFTPLIGALRNLRLFLMMFILMRVSRRLREVLAGAKVGPTLIIVAIVVVLSGIIVSRLDPSIGTVWDGMWYAWVTMSHTGYGDIVPKTAAARVFGSFLILLGVVLVTVLTASLSVFLIGSEVEHKIVKEEKSVDDTLHEILARLENIEKRLDERGRDDA